MKKCVKPIVIAASVAAVVGIGAVSFAAWTGASKQAKVEGGKTGVFAASGIATTTTTLDALLPYDQPGTAGSGKTEMWTVELTTSGDDIAGYNIKGYAKTDIEGTLYFQVQTSSEKTSGALEQPTAKITDYTTAGWTELKKVATSTTGEVADANKVAINDATLAADTYTVYIILASEDYSKDGNQKAIDLYFDLVAA